jgi:hypothetical protein
VAPKETESAGSRPVYFALRDEHREMLSWITQELPRHLDAETVQQATLIHVDFHPDTAEYEAHAGVQSGSVITRIRRSNLVRRIWWMAPAGAPALRYAFDTAFFDHARLMEDPWPSNDGPVLLSIDLDAFASREEGAVAEKDVDARVDAFLDKLRTSAYPVRGIFIAESPAYTLAAHRERIKHRLIAGIRQIYPIDFGSVATGSPDSAIPDPAAAPKKPGFDAAGMNLFRIDWLFRLVWDLTKLLRRTPVRRQSGLLRAA